MPVQADFQLPQFSDATFLVNLAPPVAIGGWSLRCLVAKRFGDEYVSGLITKSCASGYGAGQSGITILNSGQGRIQINLVARDTSGLTWGGYQYAVERLDSGSRTILTQGQLLLAPGTL